MRFYVLQTFVVMFCCTGLDCVFFVKHYISCSCVCSVLWTGLMIHAVQPSRCTRFIWAKSNISPRVRQERTRGSIVCLSSLNLSFALVFQTNVCVTGCRSQRNDVCCSQTDLIFTMKNLSELTEQL